MVVVPMTAKLVPGHLRETTGSVDNLGGIFSALLIGAIILAINFADVPGSSALVLSLAIIAVAAVIAFLVRERRARDPLYDLRIARRRVFWVAACAGIVVFGSFMGALFIGAQFLQNVLGYSTVDAGLAILPMPVVVIVVAPRSAKLVETEGARFTLLLGYACIMGGFLTMLLGWKEGIPYWKVGLAYALIGAGVGFAGTPASHSLTGSVPVSRVGMASGTADLQRDLGGAILQSIMGAILAAGYTAAATAAIAGANQSSRVSHKVQSELTKSYTGASDVAKQYPQYSRQIIAGAKQSFIHGQHWAYAAGVIAVAAAAVLVFTCFPRAAQEKQLLHAYEQEDGQTSATFPSNRDVDRARAGVRPD
jgi:hypothetical protein